MKTINSFRSKLLALTFTLMASVASFAYEFEYVNDFHIDGFAYSINSTSANNDSEEGYVGLIEIADCQKDVLVPKYVSYGDRGFHVTKFGMGSVVFTNEAGSVVESVTIPNTTYVINKNVLAGCPNLKTVVVDSENPYYDSRENCNAIITTSQNPYFTPNTLIAGCKTTIIPNSVVEIGANAFYNCQSLETITIPNSVTKIGRSAFNACSALSSITLSENLTAIGEWAFDDCNNLIEVVCYATQPPTISQYTFSGISPTIYVPAESIEQYRAADGWKDLQIQYISWSEGCEEYKHINLAVQMLPKISSMIFDISNNGTIEPPYVDSVWILKTEQEPLRKLDAQSGDTIDLSFLEENEDYILRVYINGCIKSRTFWHRVIPNNWPDTWCDTWNVMWFDGWFFDETASTSQYRLGKDTVIGDYTYSKFNARTYVRFTEDWKVYVYYEGFDDNDPYTQDLPTGEYLAYDFSAQVGDTLEVFSGIGTYSTYSCVVYDVETAPSPCVVDDVQADLKTFPLIIKLHPLCDVDGEGNMEISSEEITWIEGVGSPNGFLISDLPGRAGGGLFTLLCAYKDDELKYTGSFYERFGCEYNAGVVSDDLFPTLSGLQRTICREYYEQADNKTRIEQYTNLTTRTETGGPYIYCSPFLLRENDNKILIYSRSLNKDLVLYDFNLQVGDSLPMLYIDFFAKDDWIADSDMEIWCIVDYHKDLEGNILPADTLIVTDVSAITLLDGKEYKKWTFNNGMEYVEGIGSFGNRQWSGDFFQLIANRDIPTSLQGEHLVCVSKNNKLLYMMDDAEMERLDAECLCDVEKKWSDTWCDTWNMLVRNGSIDPPSSTPYRYQLAKDTVIGEHTYTAVVQKEINDALDAPHYVAAVRFTDDRKVYIYYDNAEYLLYDFNVQQGDELEVFAGINNYRFGIKTYKCIVTGVEQYACIGCPATITLHVPNHPDDFTEIYRRTQWQEGVGDVYSGFLNGVNGYVPVDGGGSVHLLCAYQGDELKYTGDLYEEYGCGDDAEQSPEDLFPTLWGLQRTVCCEYCGETEDDNSANVTYKHTFDRIRVTSEYKPYILFYDYSLREEDNKILIYSHILNKDLVLYDFTLEVGDSLPALYIDY